MPNVKLIINKHNKIVTDPPTNNNERTWNCINKEKYPLQEKCLTNNIMYQATLTSNKDKTFKTLNINHFRYETNCEKSK